MTAAAAGETFLESSRRLLGGERGAAFYALCQRAKIGPDDPEAALALAVASLYVDASELEPALRSASASLQESLSKFIGEIGPLLHREMGAAATQALDGTVIEVERMIRELVAQETSAAAVVRTGAIDDEVKKLSGKLQELSDKAVELKALQAVPGLGGAAAGAPSANAGMHLSLIVVGLACGLCALIGFFFGLRVHHVHF